MQGFGRKEVVGSLVIAALGAVAAWSQITRPEIHTNPWRFGLEFKNADAGRIGSMLETVCVWPEPFWLRPTDFAVLSQEQVGAVMEGIEKCKATGRKPELQIRPWDVMSSDAWRGTRKLIEVARITESVLISHPTVPLASSGLTITAACKPVARPERSSRGAYVRRPDHARMDYSLVIYYPQVRGHDLPIYCNFASGPELDALEAIALSASK